MRNGNAELTVRDTGIGIPPEHVSRIFERFQRVEGARGRSIEGSGIGLALVQELVKLHGGSVNVESRPGRGSIFKVSIPTGSEAHASRHPGEISRKSTRWRMQSFKDEAQRWTSEAAGATGEPQRWTSEAAGAAGEAQRWTSEAADAAGEPQRWTSEAAGAAGEAQRWTSEAAGAAGEPQRWTSEAAGAAGEPQAATAAPRERARILVADDNADMRDYVRRLLSHAYTVEIASDGVQALELLKSGSFDLVLADVMMPRLDGVSLLRELRKHPALSGTPLILVSARAGDESRLEGLQAAADDYLVKPFGARELLARISSRLEMVRLRQQAAERERELRFAADAERRRWRDLLLQAPAMIAVLRGPEHVFDLANPAYLRAVGRADHTALIGLPIRDALPEVAGQGYFELLDEVYRTGEPYIGNEQPVKLDINGDGTLENRYFNFVYQPSRNVAGEVEGILVHAIDVTEQVFARRRVEESERQLRILADSMPQLVWMAAPDGYVFWYNRRWHEFTGVSSAELMGWEWQTVHHPDHLDRVLDGWRESLRTGQPFEMEFPLRSAAGEYRWFLTRVTPARDESGKLLRWYGTNTDVTELRRVQEELRESEARFRDLADSMPQIVWTADAGGAYEYFNRRWYDLCGVAAGSDGQPDWDDVLHPEDRERWHAAWSRARANVELFQVECRLRDENLNSYRYHLARALPVRHGHGDSIRWYGTCTDIDDEKRAEDAIRQQQRLESTGLLAGGVAHDFNNLLTGVLGNATLLLEETPPGDARSELLEGIVNAAERAAHLTRQMLAYAGKGSFLIERLNLFEQVQAIADLVRASIPKKITVRMEIPEDLPLIEGDAGQLQQIVMNLLINAGEAIGDARTGTIDVAARSERLPDGAPDAFVPDKPRPGLYVVLEVRDDGAGMNPEVASRIFDPFFSTKFTGRGLGLSAVLGIVRSYQGALTVSSEPGRGSTFRVYLPVSDSAAAALRIEAKPTPVRQL
jgi:PAS domain S-box-containing protein